MFTSGKKNSMPSSKLPARKIPPNALLLMAGGVGGVTMQRNQDVHDIGLMHFVTLLWRRNRSATCSDIVIYW